MHKYYPKAYSHVWSKKIGKNNREQEDTGGWIAVIRYFKILCLCALAIISLDGCSIKKTMTPGFWPEKIIKEMSSESMLVAKDALFSELYLGDEMSQASLKDSIAQSRNYYSTIKPKTKFLFGRITYNALEMIQSLNLFEFLLDRFPNSEEFLKHLENNFWLFHSSANFEEQVMFTGYYEPVFEGSLRQTREYNVPVYTLPDDLVVLSLGRFRRSLKNRTIIYRQAKGNITPYYTRRQIMQHRVLRGKGMEIAWMKDPVDLFFLQIQGSGILHLPDGSYRKLGYAGANGQPYSSIGKYLVDSGIMELEEVSMQSIRGYMRNNPQLRDRILYHNKSYTFFTITSDVDIGPKGNINVPLTPGRSVATDTTAFPKGSLAYVITETPEFDDEHNLIGTKPMARFVLNQDTGGAIRGPGRVDIFWGKGKDAAHTAGNMRSFGRLYFLVAKKEVLAAMN